MCCRSFGNRQRDTQYSIRPQFRFRSSTVEGYQSRIYATLLKWISPVQSFGNNVINMTDCFFHAFTSISVLITISQFKGFMHSCRSARRNRSSPHNTRIEYHIYFYRGISPRVENFTSFDRFYFHIGLYLVYNCIIIVNTKTIAFVFLARYDFYPSYQTNKSNIDFIPTEKKYSKLYYSRQILYIFNFNIFIHFSFVYKFVLKV